MNPYGRGRASGAFEAFRQVDSRLADNANRTEAIALRGESITKRLRKPMAMIIVDDGSYKDMEKVLPILQAKHVPIGLALITSQVGVSIGALTWEQVATLVSLGAYVISHGHAHVDYTTLTDAEIIEDISTAKTILEEHGYNADYFAYPFGAGADSEHIKQIVSKYCRAAFRVGGSPYNYPPFNTYAISRTGFANGDATDGADTLENYIAKVDAAKAGNGLFVVMMHSYYDEFNETQIGYVESWIDHCIAEGIDIVNAETALNNMGNLVEAGRDGSYFAVDCDGKMYSYRNNTGIDWSTPASAFPRDQLVAYSFTPAQSPAGSGSSGGTLFAYINGSYTAGSFQIWHYANSDVWKKRRWDTAGNAWKAWVTMTPQYTTDATINIYTTSMLITDFPLGVTACFCNGTGSPTLGAGMMITYRIGGLGYDRQEFYAYKQNRKWVRFTDVDGSWTPWVEENSGNGTTSNRPKYGAKQNYMYLDATLGKPIWLKTEWVREVDTLTVTAGATTSGNISITLNGVAVDVAVTAGMTVAQVDAAIRAATIANWLKTGTAGSGVIGFHKTVPGIVTAPSFADGGTGVTASFARTVTGVDGVWIDATGTTV
jgi:peptidoglycan/xylan/chitin deacetylase (PgdA/CDA1 family)